MKIEGTVAIVTGAAQGIGKAVTDRLLKHGARMLTRDGKAAEEEFTQKYGPDRVGFIWCDVAYLETLTDAFDETYKKHKRLDIVVNNAGIQDESQWGTLVMVNYEGDTAFTNGGMRVADVCPGYVDTALGNSGNLLLPPDNQPKPVPMESVVDAYIQIVEDDSMNGVVITATPTGNNEYHFKSNEEIDKELNLF
ncbi:15-hydroxyprostaglandin dehydrogenase [NAD(+)] [Holothuria leucospilota]|uniref:15-hydroxyprostaglandin dehydrogenase [NAD(+)] n=1 Tax=Holothuria leucospilota TaxID=206669 RepID=A0A9Q1HE55_HOLLE|nr:15-hydroxyprostaglandin dehydrogenase [NAD(+)] [Holothuria leucospilota]